MTTVTLSPDRMPEDEIALLDLLRTADNLIIETGPDQSARSKLPSHRTSIPGGITIKGNVLIRPKAILEVNGNFVAGSILGKDRGTLYVSGDLTVDGIDLSPARPLNKNDPKPSTERILPAGIVVGGTLFSTSDVTCEEGSIRARNFKMPGCLLRAGGAIHVIEDIQALRIKSGRAIIAGGIIYAPGGPVVAGGRINAQLFYSTAFYPGVPYDLAANYTEDDRSVIGNILKGRVVQGLSKPHKSPSPVAHFRLPATMRDILEERTRQPQEVIQEASVDL